MSFSFDFLLNVEKLTRPAREAMEAIHGVSTELKEARKNLDALESGLGKGRGGWSGVARAAREAGAATGSQSTNLRKIADDWQKMADKAEKAEQKKTAAAERESAKRERIALREAMAQDKAAQRAAAAEERAAKRALKEAERAAAAEERAAKRALKEAERAAKKRKKAEDEAARSPIFGGYRSVSELMRETASQKMTGMTRGLAGKALGAPASLAMGAVGLAGDAISFGADLVSYTAEAAVNFGKMAISAQAMREQSVEGFKAIFGSAETSERLFDNAVRIAKLTKFDTPDVVKHFNNLAAGGFGADQLTNVFAAIADVQSARGANFGGRYSNALQKLNAQPSALFSTFQQGAMAGPGLKLAEEVLAKQLGIGDSKNIDADLRKMFREKKVSGTGAINAVLTATSQRYDQGGELGGFARKQGEGTWEGLLSNIRNGLSDVLTMRLPPNHPMMRFKGVLVEVNRLFDETTAGGKRFQALISNLVSDVFSLFNIQDGKTKEGIDKLLTVAESLEESFRGFTGYLSDSMTMLLSGGDWESKLKERLIQLVVDVVAIGSKAAIGGVFSAIGMKDSARAFTFSANQDLHMQSLRAANEVSRARDQMAENKTNDVQRGETKREWGAVLGGLTAGMSSGMESGTAQLDATSRSLAQVPIRAVREETETHSPSRVFERIGKGWVDGAVLGVEGGHQRLSDVMIRTLPGMTGSTAAPARPGDIHLHFDTASLNNEELSSLVVEQILRVIGGNVRSPSI